MWQLVSVSLIRHLYVTTTITSIAAILRSLAGAQEAATQSVNIRRISSLYDSIVASFEDLDFVNIDLATQVCQLILYI